MTIIYLPNLVFMCISRLCVLYLIDMLAISVSYKPKNSTYGMSKMKIQFSKWLSKTHSWHNVIVTVVARVQEDWIYIS